VVEEGALPGPGLREHLLLVDALIGIVRETRGSVRIQEGACLAAEGGLVGRVSKIHGSALPPGCGPGVAWDC
jgi:hypothetical protein